MKMCQVYGGNTNIDNKRIEVADEVRPRVE